MQQILDAVYENGVFRPLQHPEIPEGKQVRLVVETGAEFAPDDMLELAAQVYQGLSEQGIDKIEKVALDRAQLFCRAIVRFSLHLTSCCKNLLGRQF